MKPTIVTTEAFTLEGIIYSANVKETEALGLAGEAYRKLLGFKAKLPEGTAQLYLLQQYPSTPGFDPFRDAFKQMVAFRVASNASPTEGLERFEVPAATCARLRYTGPDSGLSEAYDLLYNRWLPAQDLRPACFDFECWGTDYRPADPSSVYDLFIPLEDAGAPLPPCPE